MSNATNDMTTASSVPTAPAVATQPTESGVLFGIVGGAVFGAMVAATTGVLSVGASLLVVVISALIGAAVMASPE